MQHVKYTFTGKSCVCVCGGGGGCSYFFDLADADTIILQGLSVDANGLF